MAGTANEANTVNFRRLFATAMIAASKDPAS